jgi:hypothetical protein
MASPQTLVAAAAAASAVEASRTDATSSNNLTALNFLPIFNEALSRGDVHVINLLLQAKPLQLGALCLDGNNLVPDANSILQCFSLLHAACADVCTVEACNYSTSSFNSDSALAILKSLPVDYNRIQTLRLRRFQVNDGVLQFCCQRFTSLTCLDVGDNRALHNVPAEIQLLSRLKTLNLSRCVNLTSLPDELLKLKSVLLNIETIDCTAITFPHPSILNAGPKAIFNFLESAQKAEPLRRVKVLFLGNGRSGKSSLLLALAKKPLQPDDVGPDSTIGISVNTLQQQLKPGFMKKLVERLPEVTYWDFAGQLEYSAAHDFFLSTRQAVNVIIFSVMDSRDSRMQQVAYVPETCM